MVAGDNGDASHRVIKELVVGRRDKRKEGGAVPGKPWGLD